MDTSDLAKRMKGYEQVTQSYLYKRMPVIIRLDGKAAHTFTKGFEKPFDIRFVDAMHFTMLELCKNIEGAVFGYTQSDEITIVLVDYKHLDTQAWFNYRTDKICSIAASIATLAFNRYFNYFVSEWENDINTKFALMEGDKEVKNLLECYHNALDKGLLFDVRCFNLPKEEVANNIYWRQLDATRNSIQGLGQKYFSHAELQNKSCSDIQDMLYETYGVNWNNYPTLLKRGTACYKDDAGWNLDVMMPLIKGEGRDYVNSLVYVGE